MSRALPHRPNLEHLKKQAKDLLPQLQEQDPGARLADAQHRVAREYGFPSWPRLKAHLAALAESPFAGRWIADLPTSKRHPANLFRSATLRIETMGDTMTISDTFVLESGDTHQGQNVLQMDGVERPAARAGYRMTVTRIGSRVVEAVVGNADGEEGRVRYEVSEDGRTLVLTDGAGTMRIVFDRAEA